MAEAKITKPMVEKLLKFTKVKGLTQNYLKSAAKMQLFYIAELSDEEKEDIVNTCVNCLKIEDYFLPIYQKHFTPEEMLDIIAFFRTKAGQKYVAEQQNVTDGVLAMFPKITVELAMLLTSEIEKRKRS